MKTKPPFVISTTEDLLAITPFVIGFQPEESVVMLACAGPTSVHARVDLPRTDDEADVVVDQLVAAALANDVTAVAVLVYSDDVFNAARLTERFMAESLFAGIDVVVALRVHDDRWFTLDDCYLEGARPEGVPFDISNHPLTVQGVLTGRITHGSRAELAATLDPDPEAVLRVEEALRLSPPPRGGDAGLRRLRSVVRRHARTRETPSDAVVAELLLTLADDATAVRMARRMGRDRAEERVEFWADVLRRTPLDHLPHAAAMTALAAYLAGDGALAWCAIDRVGATGSPHPVSRAVADHLDRAVAPSEWGA